MRLYDLDVHHEQENFELDLFPYLPSGWQEYVLSPSAGGLDLGMHKRGRISLHPGWKSYALNPFGAAQKDQLTPSGGVPGSDPVHMARTFLDAFDVEAAFLTGGVAGFAVSALSNPYFGREVARAVNRHTIDAWLSADERYLGPIILAMQVPEWTAEDIRAFADHPRMVQVLAYANPHAHAFGHPIYDPIHRACAETGLPFAIHSLGDGMSGAVPSPLASGVPSMYMEFHMGATMGLVSHLMSFIVHGVFERYPTFRLALVEAGVSWLPGFLMRMDIDFKGLRREAPWCQSLPSEYVRERVIVSSQPFDISTADDPMLDALESIGAPDFLAFASDHPHWDTDVPTKTASVMPRHWHDRVLRENARAFYGLRAPAST